MVEGKKRTIFAVLNHEAGRGPARLRRLVWDQEIAGSNPAAPTTKAAHNVGGFFVREGEKSCRRASNVPFRFAESNTPPSIPIPGPPLLSAYGSIQNDGNLIDFFF